MYIILKKRKKMKKIGKCPICKDGYIETRKIMVNNKKINLYA